MSKARIFPVLFFSLSRTSISFFFQMMCFPSNPFFNKRIVIYSPLVFKIQSEKTSKRHQLDDDDGRGEKNQKIPYLQPAVFSDLIRYLQCPIKDFKRILIQTGPEKWNHHWLFFSFLFQDIVVRKRPKIDKRSLCNDFGLASLFHGSVAYTQCAVTLLNS